jgi:hypothetical protein
MLERANDIGNVRLFYRIQKRIPQVKEVFTFFYVLCSGSHQYAYRLLSQRR